MGGKKTGKIDNEKGEYKNNEYELEKVAQVACQCFIFSVDEGATRIPKEFATLEELLFLLPWPSILREITLKFH